MAEDVNWEKVFLHPFLMLRTILHFSRGSSLSLSPQTQPAVLLSCWLSPRFGRSTAVCRAGLHPWSPESFSAGGWRNAARCVPAGFWETASLGPHWRLPPHHCLGNREKTASVGQGTGQTAACWLHREASLRCASTSVRLSPAFLALNPLKLSCTSTCCAPHVAGGPDPVLPNEAMETQTTPWRPVPKLPALPRCCSPCGRALGYTHKDIEGKFALTLGNFFFLVFWPVSPPGSQSKDKQLIQPETNSWLPPSLPQHCRWPLPCAALPNSQTTLPLTSAPRSSGCVRSHLAAGEWRRRAAAEQCCGQVTTPWLLLFVRRAELLASMAVGGPKWASWQAVLLDFVTGEKPPYKLKNRLSKTSCYLVSAGKERWFLRLMSSVKHRITAIF